MKTAYVVLVVMLCAGLWLGLSSGSAQALNAADPTGSFRYGTDFLKVAYDSFGTDSSSTWLFVQKEVGNRTAVLLFNSYDLSGDSRLYELGVTRQVKMDKGTLEVGAFTDIWHGDENDTGLMLDWSNAQVGIGTVLRTNGCSVLAVRMKAAAKTTLYLSLTESGANSPVWGIGQTVGKIRFDLSADGETTWLRATQSVGRFCPELRTKFSQGDTFLGFGLGTAF